MQYAGQNMQSAISIRTCNAFNFWFAIVPLRTGSFSLSKANHSTMGLLKLANQECRAQWSIRGSSTRRAENMPCFIQYIPVCEWTANRLQGVHLKQSKWMKRREELNSQKVISASSFYFSAVFHISHKQRNCMCTHLHYKPVQTSHTLSLNYLWPQLYSPQSEF